MCQDSKNEVIKSDSDISFKSFLLVSAVFVKAACRRSNSIWRPWMPHWEYFVGRKDTGHSNNASLEFWEELKKKLIVLLIIDEAFIISTFS